MKTLGNKKNKASKATINPTFKLNDAHILWFFLQEVLAENNQSDYIIEKELADTLLIIMERLAKAIDAKRKKL